MEMWEIEGGLPLRGEVRVARAKNAVLPQMAAVSENILSVFVYRSWGRSWTVHLELFSNLL